MIWDPQELRPIIRTLITGEPSHWDTPLGFFERHADIFYDRPRDPERMPLRRDLICGPIAKSLLIFRQEMARIRYEDWNIIEIQKILNALKQAFNARLVQISHDDVPTAQKSLYQYLRWALYGGRPGPDLASTMYYLGRGKTLERLRLAEYKVCEVIDGLEE